MQTTTITAAVLPPIIQGGMGVGVSGWRLARAVSLTGQLGVVSGTMLDVVMVRQLQLGDEGGHIRRALAEFPDAAVAQRLLQRYFIPGGKAPEAAFKNSPMVAFPLSRPSLELSVLASFVSIWLAKQGHAGVVGLNLLEKSQLPTLPLLYGAMLAGVDVVLMGAGIPRQIPGILDCLAAGRGAELRLDVTGATEEFTAEFNPNTFCLDAPRELKRPLFLAIVASAVLAENLRRKASGRVDGFVAEFPTAGGHNAPPRGALQLTESGEPSYGPRDEIDVAKFREMGLPFWLAGGFGARGKLRDARALGAMGIQVGTAFALSEESGFAPELKAKLIEALRRNDLTVFTAPYASPTRFPFKVAQLPGTLAEAEIYQQRERVCDLGVLRETYLKPDGKLGFRCSAEPVADYIAKGGDPARTHGTMCLCNSLAASIDLPQLRAGVGSQESAIGTRESVRVANNYAEPPLITLGDDLESIRALLPEGSGGYSAAAVVHALLA